MSIQEAVWRVLRQQDPEGCSVARVLSKDHALLVRDGGYWATTLLQDWLPDIQTARLEAAQQAQVTIGELEQGDDRRLNALYTRLSTMADCVPWNNMAQAISTLSPIQHAIIKRLGADRSYKEIARDLSMKVKAVARIELQARHQVDHTLRNQSAANESRISTTIDRGGLIDEPHTHCRIADNELFYKG